MSEHYARIATLTETQRQRFARRVHTEAIKVSNTQFDGGQIDDAARETLYDRLLTEVETGEVATTGDAEQIFNYEVADELRKLRVREAARRRLAAENTPPAPPPTPTTLEDLLAQPDDPATYRVEGVLPIGACMLFVAIAKFGKTSIIISLVRALVDGTLFLGKYRVEPVEFGVTIFDNEMDPRMTRAWFRKAGIKNTHLVHIVSLRGRTAAFDILDPKKRFELVKLYEGSEVYILDALRPALDSFALDENREAGRYVQAWKNFVYELGGEESIIVHHMGHSGERARGDSGLLGGVDGTWKGVLQDPGDASREVDPATATRFFSAYGRDVNEPEQQLGGPPERMEIVGGSRKESSAEEAAQAVIDAIQAAGEPLSWRGVHDALAETPFTRRTIDDGIKAARKNGRVFTFQGPKRATLHALNNPTSAPVHRSAP
ncbi:AAA family ATPase [Paeniglutamicibacter sp.]|uniref:AAA family ATPase n=1 Tax=Paeniglutamicibacter sp. TaxID=1934391 RepID=UPI0039895EEC